MRVPPGEVFCRMPMADGTLCPKGMHQNVSSSSLRTHIKSHRIDGENVTIFGVKRGTMSACDHYVARIYWEDIKNYIQAKGGGGFG